MARRPSNGNIGDGFGWREKHPITGVRTFHYGEDIGRLAGLTLVAPADCTLLSYATTGGFGRLATLRVDARTRVRLAHTERLWPGVSVGDAFDEGDPVAVMGETGAAKGTHVHWEVLVDGVQIDPAGWLASFAGGGANPFPTPTTEDEDDDDMNGYYWYVDSAGPKYWRSFATGKSRQISKDEWDSLRGMQKGSVPKLVLPQIVQVGQGFADKYLVPTIQ